MASAAARLLWRRSRSTPTPVSTTGRWAIGHGSVQTASRRKRAEAHLAQADDEDEATILMATFCALHDIEAEEKGEVTVVEGPGKALKAVDLDEPRAQVLLEHVGGN